MKIGKLIGSEENSIEYVISDNANSSRNMVQRVFGQSVVVKQDPFHVIQRLTEKIRDKAQRKFIAGELRKAVYVGGEKLGELRNPPEMLSEIKQVIQSIHQKDLSCSAKEWAGTVQNNLRHIELGDLYVKSNKFLEAGQSVQIVSTSQLESFHSQLKRLLDRCVSVPVGLRILDIFIFHVSMVKN